MKRISAGGAVLLLVSVLAMLFSLTFAYRWYEGHQAADRVWKDGRCLNASIESINDGKYCPANARLTRENADRDLRFALVGVAVTVIAGGAAFVMTRKNEGSTPAHYDEIDPNTRGHRRDLSDAGLPNQLRDLADLHDSGSLSDAEFQKAKRKLLE